MPQLAKEIIKAYMQKALDTYPEVNDGYELSVMHEGYPFLSVFLFDQGPESIPKLKNGGYSLADLDPVPEGKTRVILSAGTWYQPAYARYDGPWGRCFASLRGGGESRGIWSANSSEDESCTFHFNTCTKLRDDLPYWAGEYEGPQNHNLWYRNGLYNCEQLRAHSTPRRKKSWEICQEIAKLKPRWGWYAEHAINNIPYGEWVYPSSLHFSTTMPGTDARDIHFNSYSWEMLLAYNLKLGMSGEYYDAGVAKYGETFWDGTFMAQKSITMTMLDLCLTVATFGVPPFCDFYKQAMKRDIPRDFEYAGQHLGFDMLDCLGDAWRILLYHWWQHRKPALCWYELH